MDGVPRQEEPRLKILGSPTGYARANLRFIEGIRAPYGSLDEAVAIGAFKKNQRIELLRTIATVTATVNPEKAQAALQRLIEETFPEHKIERERAVDRAMELMEEERHKVYAVVPTGMDTRKGTSLDKMKGILGRRRSRRG